MFTIRTATVDDARRIGEIKVAGWRTAYRGLMPDQVLDDMSVDVQAERFRERIAADPDRVLVAAEGDAVAGYVSMGQSRDFDPPDPTAGEIYALYVDPYRWRAGIGSALMAAALASLRDLRFRHVSLWVLAGNDRAISFYQARGFRPDGREKLETWGTATLRELAMARTL